MVKTDMKIVGTVTSKADAKQIEDIAKLLVVEQRIKRLCELKRLQDAETEYFNGEHKNE